MKRLTRLALPALGLSIVALAAAVSYAARPVRLTEPYPPASGTAATTNSSTLGARHAPTALDPARLAGAAERNPFRADRRRSPADLGATDKSVPSEGAVEWSATPLVQLIGVGVSGELGTAGLRIDGGVARVLRVGQGWQGARLVAVGPDSAIVEIGGSLTVLRMARRADNGGGE